MTQTELIAQLPPSGRSSDREYLTLQSVADLCGVSYKMARQYADVDAVKTFTGAYQHPSSKGVRYPPESETRWKAIFDAAQKRLILPGNVGAWLQNIEVSPAIAQLPTSGELLPVEVIAQLPQQGETVIALLKQLVNSVPPPDDRLLTMAEAARQYGVPVHVLRPLRVRIGNRLKVRRSDVLHIIQQLKTV